MREKKIRLVLAILLFISIGMFSFTAVNIYSGESNKITENKYIYPPFSDGSTDKEEQSTLLLSSEDGPPLTMDGEKGTLSLIVKEAFHRIGINVTIIILPAERALQNARDGITDGDYTRIAGLETYYPNLVMVPEKLVDYEFVAFTKNADIEINSWESLNPYDTGFVTGWKIFDQNIKGVKSITGARDEKLLFKLLEKDRVDIITHSRYGGEYLIKEMKLKDVKILEPPLAVRPMYLYLNKKHKSLILPLVSSLRSMKRDGTYNSMMNSFSGL